MDNLETNAQSVDEGASVGPTLESLQAALAEERKSREETQAKLKDLSGRLTKAQQESAETQRFLRATLPKINPVIEKSFADRWEESPEKAVETQVEHKLSPMEQRIADLQRQQQIQQAQTALATVMAEHPDWAKFKARAVELGDDPSLMGLTYTQPGIEKLFRMARAEELEARMESAKSNGAADAVKGRAFAEESGSRAPVKSKKALNPHQRTVARNLGLTEEQYLKNLEEIDAETQESAGRFSDTEA